MLLSRGAPRWGTQEYYYQLRTCTMMTLAELIKWERKMRAEQMKKGTPKPQGPSTYPKA